MAVKGRKIAVVGAGAIGSSVSADLTHAGLDITVIDQWPAQVEALKATGLHIQIPDGDVKVPMRALHLCELASANRSEEHTSELQSQSNLVCRLLLEKKKKKKKQYTHTNNNHHL